MDTNCVFCCKPLSWDLNPNDRDTIEEMVADYRKVYMQDTDEWIKSLVTFTDFICGSRNKVEAPDLPESIKFCKNLHQYRMPHSTVKDAYAKLISANLGKYENFADVYDAVVIATQDIAQFGPLAAYDFTQRYCYSRGIDPDGVYLHAGVEKGVIALKEMGIDFKVFDYPLRGRMVKLKSLPKPIAKLGALHAENFLCVYKSVLAKLASSKKG